MKFLKRILSAVLSAVMTVTAIAVPVSAEEIKLPDNEAIAFVDSLGAIWNLGNAFDAVDCTWLSNKLDYETGWCGCSFAIVAFRMRFLLHRTGTRDGLAF